MLVEIDFDVAEDDEKYSKNNIYTNLYQQESFYKEDKLSVFVIHLRECDSHLKSFIPVTVNFLRTGIGFVKVKTLFPRKTRLHCINFTS